MEQGFVKRKIILVILIIAFMVIVSTQAMIHINQDPPKSPIPRLIIDHDQDGDGINDLDDIIEGARKDVARQPTYRSAYYVGGYPPDDEGVCTDVVWRAFKNAGYNLKEMVDRDIRANVNAYPRVGGHPDPNIDFRRVPNLVSFFERNATVLTVKLIPNDLENLQEWQGGDIVAFGKPFEHVGIISDRRGEDGVPLMIHNAGCFTTKEEDVLVYWTQFLSKIVGHYRWPNN